MFKYSYNIGKKGEHYVIDIFNNCGFKAEINNVYETRYDYDVKVNMEGINFTIEVKHDVMSIKTGNLAIEYHNSKKDAPSGICATLADVWVQLIPQKDSSVHSYAISVKKLKEITGVDDLTTLPHVHPFKHIKNGGDANSCMLIYKLDNILPFFTRIDTMTDPAILKITMEKILSD